ncbi:unnamed protein product [Calicophoron daubneyi]|uniref:RING-type E3 ubiquitin transferase n=1 Tax=Calicophoron daubneyi TaxID=300641 RepID=A0AAV2TVB6_CALDB
MSHTSTPDGIIPRSRPLSRTISESSRSQTNAPIICYVTQADDHVLHVEVEHRADGQEVLYKICKTLGIIDEAEYFGIQFMGLKNEMLWLNNRNRLSKQIPGSPPYHLYFRVKFYVLPHSLLVEETRHQFYINVVQQLKSGVWDAETSLETQANLIALMAYVQFGKYNPNTTPCKYACFWPDCRGEIPADAIRMAANFHRALDAEGCTISHAKYELIRISAMEFPCYGTYFYDVKDVFDHRLMLGVGPEGLTLCSSSSSVIDRFPYCRVHTVTTSARVVTLNLLEDDGSVKARNYQLSTARLAGALYRSVTEVHAFFRCDSVRDHVLLQTTRDFKDAFTSMFDHSGKDYAFDVRYTFREIYDRARRHLYHCTSNTSTNDSPPNPLASNSALLALDGIPTATSSSEAALRASGDSASTPSGMRRDLPSRTESIISDVEVQELVQERLREVALCRLCVDAPISRVFFPCGHIVCCADCAERVDQCPICRKTIEIRHPCFLPWTIDAELENHIPTNPRRPRRQSEQLESESSKAPSTLLHHTLSAPTCNLMASATTCLNPSLDKVFDEDTSFENLLVPSSADRRVRKITEEEEVESTSGTATKCNSPNQPSTVNTTPVHATLPPTVPFSALSCSSPGRIPGLLSETQLSSNPTSCTSEVTRHRPAHVTWQGTTD